MGMPLKCEYQIKYNTSIHDLFIVTLSLLKGNGRYKNYDPSIKREYNSMK